MNKAKRDFDREAATWDEDPRRVKLAYDVADAITEEITLTPDMDVLDFGCGTGLLSLCLRPRVRSVMGVDTSSGMLKVLKDKVKVGGFKNVKTRLLDHSKGVGLAGRYHLIVSNMTLHHIQEVKVLLERFHEVLDPSGQLCVADLDLDGGAFHAGNSAGVFHNGFDRIEFRRFLAEAGFKDVRVRTAAEVKKPSVDGVERMFSIFLMMARK